MLVLWPSSPGHLSLCIATAQRKSQKDTGVTICHWLGQTAKLFLPPGVLFFFSSKFNFSLKVSHQMVVWASKGLGYSGNAFYILYCWCRLTFLTSQITNFLKIVMPPVAKENFRDVCFIYCHTVLKSYISDMCHTTCLSEKNSLYTGLLCSLFRDPGMTFLRKEIF